jgi:hypothetical protein
MRARTLLGLGLAAALVAGAVSLAASAQNGPGYGPGYHMGWGGGPWNCPGFGRGDESGPGYGPGYHMRGWGGGPGMMRGWGYGRGWGPGYGPRGGDQALNLSVDDVKSHMERWLSWRNNPRLKLGEVKEKDADSITADIVTKDNSVVERFIFDRHTGAFRRDNS